MNDNVTLTAGRVPLDFNKETSKMLRGLAIILMVTNHTCPGTIIPMAAQFFSFMVGYGYAFSRERSLRQSLRRCWHLLWNFWIILFGICLPVALYVAPKLVIPGEVLLNMFGLFPRLNFFCWYVWFYMAMMLVLPALTRLMDRYGWCMAALLIAISMVGSYLSRAYFDMAPTAWPGRLGLYFPQVVMGYMISKRKIFSMITYRPGWVAALAGFALLGGSYLLYGVESVDLLGFILVPMMVAGFSLIADNTMRGPGHSMLARLGEMSMDIWFLHALFFTHVTRPVFLPLISWAPNMVVKVLAILLLSWAMAEVLNLLKSPKHVVQHTYKIFREKI